MAHVYADRAAGRTRARAGGWTAGCWTARPARRSATSAASPRRRCSRRSTPPGGATPVVADLAAGPEPVPAARARRSARRARAVLCDIDAGRARAGVRGGARARRRRPRRRRAGRARSTAPRSPRCARARTSSASSASTASTTTTRSSSATSPTSPRPSRRRQIVCNVQVANPEIEYIARVWRNAEGERCVWRLRPAEQIEGYARAAGYEPASVTADRHGIYRVMRFVRRRRARGGAHELLRPDLGRRSRQHAAARRPSGCARSSARHHAMWNYLTYRDAIGIVGLDPAELYPGGTTRLDPATWADLGWLTCFAGPAARAPSRRCATAVTAEHLNQYSPDLIEPLRDAAAGVLGRAARRRLRGHRHRGRAGRASRCRSWRVAGPGRRGHPVGPRLLPRARRRSSPRAPRRSPCRSTPATATASIPTSSPPRSRRARGRSSSSTRSTRTAPCRPPSELAALARLADEHGLLLIHDVTHGSLVIDPDVPFASLPALELTDNAVATFSVSHCFGMAGARIGFLAGPSRAHAQLPAAEGRADAPEHEPHRPARRARGAARRRTTSRTRRAIVRGNLAHLRGDARRRSTGSS